MMRPTLELLEHGLRDRAAYMPASVRSGVIVTLLQVLPRTVRFACNLGDNDLGLTAFGAIVRVWNYCHAYCGREVYVEASVPAAHSA